jgi:hypothetical protein
MTRYEEGLAQKRMPFEQSSANCSGDESSVAAETQSLLRGLSNQKMKTKNIVLLAN